MATLGVSALYYSIVKKWLLNLNTAERAWNHTEGHWHDPLCDPDILTNNTIVHSHRADCLPITCSWNYPQHSKWSKCHLTGSWNFTGLMRNGSAQHVKGQPCHVWGGSHDISPAIHKSRLGCTTSNQRGKNNRNSGNTHRLRLPRKTNWWGPQGRWWPRFSGMQTKSSTTGGLPEKGHMITGAYWADLLRHLQEKIK